MVCTYRRENAIAKKISEFSEPIPGHHLYIIDNGNTLVHTDNGNQTIVGSPNLGGSGGFSNGILRTLEDGCTHIILNDDDAFISRESVFRTVMFTAMLRPSYSDVSIAGTMLNINNPAIVYEAGSQFRDGFIHSLKSGLDTSTDEGLIKLLGDEHIDCADWTFLCVPSSEIRKVGLPLPLFMHYDDIEYCLRMGNPIITLPGVYAWHPVFYDSFSPTNYYYNYRNRMVILSCSGGIPKGYIDRLCDKMGVEVAAYRYECCEEMIDGIRDYLEGPDHVFSLCRQGRRKGRTVDLQDIDELRKGLHIIESAPAASFRRRKLTLNGIMSRAVGDIESAPSDFDTAHFYRIDKVLYHVRDKGFITKRSRFRTISCAVRITLLKHRMKRSAPSLVGEYRASMGRYTSGEFWNELLKEQPEGPHDAVSIDERS